MNPINLSVGGEIDSRRGAGRIESERTIETTNNSPRAATNSPKEFDSISLSDRGAVIGELTAKADQLPEVRQEKVERLKSEVQTGNYRPSAAEIADALFKEV